MLRFQPQREALLPPDVLMNLALKIEQHQITVQMPLRFSLSQFNTEDIGASPRASTHKRLTETEGTRHRVPRAQPDQPIKGCKAFKINQAPPTASLHYRINTAASNSSQRSARNLADPA
jgi:hypothetical protein